MSAAEAGLIRLTMSMSVDGFVTGPDDGPGQGLGRDGGRLFNWLDDRMSPGVNGQVYAEYMATGAVIAGRRTFEISDRWAGDHHGGVPILVLTHDADDDPGPGARFYSDVAACAAEARAAAGSRAVMVHGASAGESLLLAGELDEIEIHLVPVLLGSGRRLFAERVGGHDELELVRRLEGRDATHLRFRVVRDD